MGSGAEALDRDDHGITLHGTLKYSLLGPSLTKAGQDAVNQQEVSEIIYEASRGSKYFNNEENRDKVLTLKIEKILAKKRHLESLDLKHDQRKADEYLAELELSRDLTQLIVHVDCDAFYAAVEQLDRPELAQLPFAVGKGVLTTCNYHARKFGCRSGMAGFVAKKLCPQLIMLPLNFDKYTAKAQEVREILGQFDPRFESASIDEAYLNITSYCKTRNIDPEEAVAQLRGEVEEKTNITVSAGIAANAKLAKICSNINKPNGQFRLPNDRERIMMFMRSLPARKVNGIGRVFERELDAIGIRTCGEIYQYRQYLSQLFGEKAFKFLMQCYLGLGRTAVQPAEDYERKSIGTESTFSQMSGHDALCDKLRHTTVELEKDMVKAQFKGRTLVLKIKLHTYEVFTRQVIPPKAIYLAEDLYKYAVPMLIKLEQDFPGMVLRLMGLRCTHLVSMTKPNTSLFFGLRKWPSANENDCARSATLRHAGLKRRLSSVDDNSNWEVSGEDDFEETENDERKPQFEESNHSGREAGMAISQLTERNPSQPVGTTGKPQEEFWDCPVCSRPQAAHEKMFNEHIDICLSRQTIREAVQDLSNGPFEPRTLETIKRTRHDAKNSTKSTVDGRQTRLRFT